MNRLFMVNPQRGWSLSGPFTLLAVLLFVAVSGRSFAECGTPNRLLRPAAALEAHPSISPSISMAKPQLPILNQRQSAGEQEAIVGLWLITITDDAGDVLDRVISGWTSDGLEFDQDISPILTGYVCYGAWIKLGDRTFGLSHPYFTFQDVNSNGEGSESTEGQWDGNSAYFTYKVTVDKSGRTFSGKTIVKVVEGPDPYDPNATVLFTGTANLSATKVTVDESTLP